MVKLSLNLKEGCNINRGANHEEEGKVPNTRKDCQKAFGGNREAMKSREGVAFRERRMSESPEKT